MTMHGSATDRTSRNFIVTHPLDPEDAAITAVMRTMASSAKGARPGIEARGQFDAFMESVLPRDDVTFEADTLGGIPGLWAHPADWRSDDAIVHLHGGWFNFGSAKAYRHLVGHIAARAGARAFIPDYRLAPEHPFPAATDDVLSCYQGLAERDVQRIALTGDSAGGNLALVLASRVTGKAAPTGATLVGVAVLSPVTDLTLSGATYETRADADPFLPVRRSRSSCIPTSGAPIRVIHWLRPSTVDFPACLPSAFTSVTTKCCWTIRFGMSSVPLPPESMPGLMCGWGCHMGFPEASES
jgi:monoterpene epsilon-lactone hydrolase